MARRATIALLAASLVAVAPAAAQTSPDVATATKVGFDAYEYGLPLTEFTRVRDEETSVKAPDGKGNEPVNVLGNVKGFPSAADRTVVAPNVDTLYTIAQLDLGRHPMVLSTPNMGKRFWVFEFVDPYTNVIGYVGTRTTGQKARRTAIVWGQQKAPRGTKVLRSPYRRVWVIGRTLVNGSKDLAAARKVMRSYKLTPRPRYKGPPGNPTKATTPEGVAFYDALAQDMKDNPPPARDATILEELASVGIEPGAGPSANNASADVRTGLEAGYKQAQAEIAQRGKLKAIQGAMAAGGWYFPPRNIGNYGTDYPTRADIAVAGLGANTPEEAVYPIALTDQNGALLNSALSYTITFPADRQPPQKGFWSLTMYDINGYLVDNAAGIHAIGPTHDGFVKKPDGSVVVAVQTDRPSDPTVNWLPPPGTGLFRLNLRLYWPDPSVLNGSWKPPPVILTG
jgi:hypothetical protein